jgi:hypothetical protein
VADHAGALHGDRRLRGRDDSLRVRRVADSLDNNGTSAGDPLYRPGLGRLALFAARSYFSLTARIPALRRKFLAGLSIYRDDTGLSFRQGER